MAREILRRLAGSTGATPVEAIAAALDILETRSAALPNSEGAPGSSDFASLGGAGEWELKAKT